jgi:hypothetical protein
MLVADLNPNFFVHQMFSKEFSGILARHPEKSFHFIKGSTLQP